MTPEKPSWNSRLESRMAKVSYFAVPAVFAVGLWVVGMVAMFR